MSTTTGFDVRAYLRDPHGLRPGDLDLDALEALDAGVLDVLTHLWSVERGMLDRMRDVLLTPTHADSRVTAFLTTWAYEQYWLAETLRAGLAANGRAAREPSDTASGRIRRAWDERGRPTVHAVCSNLLGADVTGAQMAVSRLDTAVLCLAYQRLGTVEPRLAEPVGAVLGVKERHLAFYTEEAAARLAAGAGARRLARTAMARWRWPGTHYAGTAPAAASVRRLLPGPVARAAVRVLDDDAAALPGLAGIRPARTALVRLAGRDAVSDRR